MSKRILFVVHRYVPFEGGSEYYVRDMAKEMFHRGYDVTVLAHEHKGDQGIIKVTSDYNILVNEKWDLVVVHGGDVISQNIVHANAYQISQINPVCYMLIKPSESEVCMNGLNLHKVVSYSTKIDIDFLKKHGKLNKARRIRHGIVPETTMVKLNLVGPTPYYVSAGGFWPHKAFVPLAEAWEKSDITSELHLYGYGPGFIGEDTDRVKWIPGKSREDVMYAIAGAQGYIMNSYEEGFGLVLLEAMMNETPWYARAGSGAADDLSEYGTIYSTEDGLIDILKDRYDWSWKQNPGSQTKKAFDYVMANHTITQTCNDIEDIISELQV